MKSAIVNIGILRKVDNRLTIHPDCHAKKRFRHVHLVYDPEKTVDKNETIKNRSVTQMNQLPRVRKILNTINIEASYHYVRNIEQTSSDPNDLIKAYHLYNEWSNLGHLDSSFRIGQILVEDDLFPRTEKNLLKSLEYFTKLRFEIEHPKHDDAMDYIQDIYIILGTWYEHGINVDRDIENALVCYQNLSHRTQDIQQKIIALSLRLVDLILEQENISLTDYVKVLELYTNVSHMCPDDLALKVRIQELTFQIGRDSLEGIKFQQNLKIAYKYLESLYAEEPEYPGLRDLLKKVIEQGILPEGFDHIDNDQAIESSEDFLRFVFKKQSQFQKINHDEFMSALIMDSVMALLLVTETNGSKGDEESISFLSTILESYF